jgi:hypothetical protein
MFYNKGMKRQPHIGAELRIYVERKPYMDEDFVNGLLEKLSSAHHITAYALILENEIVLTVNMAQSGIDKSTLLEPVRQILRER